MIKTKRLQKKKKKKTKEKKEKINEKLFRLIIGQISVVCVCVCFQFICDR